MASVTAMRNALATTIQAGLGSGVNVYPTVAAAASFPAIVVEPAKADFDRAFGRGMDEWFFNVFVLMSRANDVNAQETLDPFISGAGPKSVRQIVFQNPTLGLTDGSQAVVHGMRGYSGSPKQQGIPMIGAILLVCIYTNGAV